MRRAVHVPSSTPSRPCRQSAGEKMANCGNSYEHDLSAREVCIHSGPVGIRHGPTLETSASKRASARPLRPSLFSLSSPATTSPVVAFVACDPPLHSLDALP